MKTLTLNKNSNRILSIFIIGLYLISLFLESFSDSGGVYGIFALLFGGLTIFFGLFTAFIAWCGNILFFIALARKNQIKAKRNLSGLAIILGLTAIFVTELPVHEGSTTSPVKIGIGFYIWILSFILLFIKSLINWNNQKNEG